MHNEHFNQQKIKQQLDSILDDAKPEKSPAKKFLKIFFILFIGIILGFGISLMLNPTKLPKQNIVNPIEDQNTRIDTFFFYLGIAKFSK